MAAAGWLGIILLESTNWASAQNTGGLLRSLFSALFGQVPQGIESLHFALRKLGHFLGYGILAWLLLRAWRATLPLAGFARWALFALAMTAIVAAADELHQASLASRGGSFRDVLLDMAGASFFVYLAWYAAQDSRRRA